MLRFAVAGGLLITVLACSPPAEEAGREGVFDDQVETLDRARSVEQGIMDADEERRRALEEQGG